MARRWPARALVRCVALAASLALLMAGPATTAHAEVARGSRGSARVDVAKVDVPASRPDAYRLEATLRSLIKKAARGADFGDGERILLRARLEELRHEKRGDVVRIHCTIAGRIEGGKGARSHIRYGGRADQAAKLEKQVLEMVARGLVARLAAIARDQPTPRAKTPADALGKSLHPR